MSDKPDFEARVTELEMKVAFQEQTIETLNGVVTELRDEIDRLIREVEALKVQLRAVAPSLVADRSDEKPPPHY
ncbi:phi X174 lysis protein [Sulfurifustis variabilis]|uniref:Protein SlyX homolog n=1 Tax=Sulfurifustis variabilis TaxID=1675686 RepID=A0A1B4V2R9_9GAMM|nr:SlyX family protein [Sulfurifustis variabilis]BAU47836.1 phi X174 lysis protein [Sulfurifustis variabilis]